MKVTILDWPGRAIHLSPMVGHHSFDRQKVFSWQNLVSDVQQIYDCSMVNAVDIGTIFSVLFYNSGIVVCAYGDEIESDVQICISCLLNSILLSRADTHVRLRRVFRLVSVQVHHFRQFLRRLHDDQLYYRAFCDIVRPCHLHLVHCSSSTPCTRCSDLNFCD